MMAAEVPSLILGFDLYFVMRDMITDIMGNRIPLEDYVDNRTVFEVIAKDAITTERRLQIDVAALKESYIRGELDNIGGIPGPINAADGMTKICG